MAAIDREHDFDLSAEPQEHRHEQHQHQHQQANQGQDQEGEEKEDEGGAVRTTAAPAAAAAHPVEPTKAILGATAVAEAIERAITVTKKTQQDTEDAVSTFCDTMARNQVRHTYDMYCSIIYNIAFPPGVGPKGIILILYLPVQVFD